MSLTSTPPHPNIVRAWFDTVLNPLVRALRTEAAVLVNGNLTWRCEQRRLASLVPVRSHVPVEAWDNYDQFRGLNPQCEHPIQDHDRRLQVLFNSCETLAARLVDSRALRETFARAVETLPPNTDVAAVFGACTPGRYHDVITEYIINNVQRLPGYYSTASFWNDHRQEFLAVRGSDEIRPHWEATVAASHRFAGAVDQLIGILSELRNNLSLSAGVPIVDQLVR
ncbi:MAG TPA: hypothetical protein VGZ73_18920 [Bryobacteraceae bacterium]|nr:hypothetical protein [Bryobacteraceae bacterium]